MDPLHANNRQKAKGCANLAKAIAAAAIIAILTILKQIQ